MKKLKLLFNPFERYSELLLIAIGAVGFVIGSLLGCYFNGRFDGAFDLHFVENTDLLQSLSDNSIATFSLFIVFAIAGKILYAKTRLVDVLAVSLIARFPLYLLTLSNINNISYSSGLALLDGLTDSEMGLPINDIIISLSFGLIGILLIIWMIVLLFKGFKLITHGKGVKLVIFFILAIILSEVVSKAILYLLN